MNPRIAKIKDEMEKLKDKLNKGQIRYRELEKQLTDLENADIVAAVRGVDIAPDELAAFVQMFREKQNGGTVPNLETIPNVETTANEPLTKGETALITIIDDEEDSI
ncbi:MAG: DUF4315 family protein [Defluviitaleaceae bacterium]|nr:DUF4315 family protein [Defluviitaleaceae bacterium]